LSTHSFDNPFGVLRKPMHFLLRSSQSTRLYKCVLILRGCFTIQFPAKVMLLYERAPQRSQDLF
jgi:hypothetical protein